MGLITNKIYICLPFEKEIDKLDWNGLSTEEYNGKNYYKIPSGGSSSDVVKKITFETLKDNVTVTLNIVSSSERNYDFAYACELDGTYGYSNAKYKISGDNQSKTCEYVVPTKGSHWIYIGYRKDGSGNSYKDCGYFSIDILTREYLISQPKEVYLASNKMKEITYGSKKILEHGLGNTISWETLRWNKSNNSYTYNTKDRLTFSYYLSSSKNYAYLYNSPNNIPNNGKINLVVFNDINSYYPNNSYNLTYKLDLSDWDTSNVTNMNNMFNYCIGLTYVDVSGFNTSNVIDMHNMFGSDIKLSNFRPSIYMEFTDINLGNIDTSKVTNMKNMFCGCRKLTNIDVSRFDTSNVTDMNNMFNSCEKLITLDVSKWDVSNVTNMDSMFRFCHDLNSLDVSKWDVSNVTNMNNMFSSCVALTSLDLSGWYINNVKNNLGIFNFCYQLTTLIDGHESDPNVTILNGLKFNIDFRYSTKLNYESIYALFRGVATVTTNKFIVLPQVMEGKLDAAKVKIATDKGWTIKYS